MLRKRIQGRLRFCTFLHLLYPRPRKLPIFSFLFMFGLNVKNAVTDKWYVLTFYSAPPGALRWKNNRIKRITGGCNSGKIFTFLLLGLVQTPMVHEPNLIRIKVFRYSFFSKAIPIFFNRLKSVFFLV